MTSTEVDKTGSSYYGKQTLHFIPTKGEPAMVLLGKNVIKIIASLPETILIYALLISGKEGPVYSVEWNPKSTEFCVVYGFMPAKATLFNLKGEAIFDFGTGPRNSIHYNPHGNNILLCSF